MSALKLTVSQLARIAGVGPDSIRHCERIGLVPKAERSPAGYRLWTAREVQYLKWVASAKRAGFTLRELAEIFRMYRAGSAPCRTVRDLLQRKLADLDREVDELSNLRAQLRRVFVRWKGRLRRASSGDFVPLFDDPARRARQAINRGFDAKKPQRRKAMIYALVTFHVQPSKVHEFESLHRVLARFISGQPGCIAVKVHRSLKNPQEYVVYGTWEGKEAWERAHQTAEFKTQFQNLPIERHTLSSASFFDVAYAYQGGEVAPHS